MDGLAISAALIQFIDFSSRLISKGISIHEFVDGCEIDHRELESITKSLSGSIEEIQHSLQSQRRQRELTDTERQQERIGEECQSVANDLLGVLNQLKAKGPRTKWQSFRQALRATWNDGKVKALERRLDRFRMEIVASILNTLRSVLLYRSSNFTLVNISTPYKV